MAQGFEFPELERFREMRQRLQQRWDCITGDDKAVAAMRDLIGLIQGDFDSYGADLDHHLWQRISHDVRQQERMTALAATHFDPAKSVLDMMQTLAEITADLLPCSAGASLLLWHPEHEAFQMAATTIPGQSAEEVVTKVRSKGGASRWIVDNLQPIIVSDIKEDSFNANRMLSEYGIEAYVGMPIIYGDKVLGVLYAIDSQPTVRTETDIHFLKILSIRAASVLTQARLLADRAALLEQSQALHRVSSSLVSAGHLPSLMQKVSDVVCDALRVDRVLLILIDVAAQCVQEVYQSPLERALPVYSYEHYMSGLTGWAVVHQQTVFSSKHGVDSRESEESQAHRMTHEVGSIVVAPLLYEGRCLGTLTVIRSPAQDDFDHREVEMIESISNQAATAIEYKRLYDSSKHLADTDSLTGLNNRRRFFELGNQEFQRAQRTSRPLSAIMIDVDHFKRINDSYGHATGDEVLKTVASRLLQAIRKIDILGRYGGEEFSLLLPEATITMASEIAERIRESIKLELTTTAGVSLSVTATLGVASLGSDTIDLYRVLDKADRALYQGKNAGRNCIYVL